MTALQYAEQALLQAALVARDAKCTCGLDALLRDADGACQGDCVIRTSTCRPDCLGRVVREAEGRDQEKRCDCGRELTVCSGCAIEDYEATHADGRIALTR